MALIVHELGCRALIVVIGKALEFGEQLLRWEFTLGGMRLEAGAGDGILPRVEPARDRRCGVLAVVTVILHGGRSLDDRCDGTDILKQLLVAVGHIRGEYNSERLS